MEGYPSKYVVDTSLLIDLYIGKIIGQFFQLPYTFIAPDVIIAELHEPAGKLLIELGLQQMELAGEEVLEVIQLRSRYPKPSVNDLFALILARLLKATLLTNDGNLRKAAEQEGIAVHGTLWVLDEMVQIKIISPLQAIEALQGMLNQGSRLPEDECEKRLSLWAYQAIEPRYSNANRKLANDHQQDGE